MACTKVHCWICLGRNCLACFQVLIFLPVRRSCKQEQKQRTSYNTHHRHILTYSQLNSTPFKLWCSYSKCQCHCQCHSTGVVDGSSSGFLPVWRSKRATVGKMLEWKFSYTSRYSVDKMSGSNHSNSFSFVYFYFLPFIWMITTYSFEKVKLLLLLTSTQNAAHSPDGII